MQLDPRTDADTTTTIHASESTHPTSDIPDGFPSADELASVEAHLDDVETVLKSLDVDKGLEARCAELAEQNALDDRPALAAYWLAKTEAANRQ